MKKGISIVIPVFNTEIDFLDKCVDSIINQRFLNYEIIIINDGSSDEYSKEYLKYNDCDNIRYYKKENEGVSETRNLGIKLSEYEWIMFVDADDWLEDSALEKLYSNLNNEIDVVISKCYINIKKEQRDSKCYYDKNIKLDSIELKNELIDSIFKAPGFKFNYIESPWAKLYRKEFLVKENIKFNSKLKIGEDSVFNYLCYKKANSIFFCATETYHYRINDDSVSQKLNKEIIPEYEKLYEVYLNLIDKEEMIKFNYFIFFQLKKYLKKYFFNKSNHNSIFNIEIELRKLLKKKIYTDSINYSFKNIKKFKFNDKFYLIMLKFKLLLLMNLYFKVR